MVRNHVGCWLGKYECRLLEWLDVRYSIPGTGGCVLALPGNALSKVHAIAFISRLKGS